MRILDFALQYLVAQMHGMTKWITKQQVLCRDFAPDAWPGMNRKSASCYTCHKLYTIFARWIDSSCKGHGWVVVLVKSSYCKHAHSEARCRLQAINMQLYCQRVSRSQTPIVCYS